jgi:hypothetical protein
MDLGDFLWSILVFYFIFIYFMMLFRVIVDVFRSTDLSGLAKTGWLILLLVLPVISLLIYVIARGDDMASRDVAQAQQMQQQQDDYIRQVSGSAQDPAEQIARAQSLLTAGSISQAEFDQLKAKALA